MPRGAEDVEEIYAEMGERIRQARKRAGLSLKELGSLIEPPMDQSSLSAYENGLVRLKVHHLVQLANLLDVHALDLIPGLEPRAADGLEAQNSKLRACIIGALKELQKGV